MLKLQKFGAYVFMRLVREKDVIVLEDIYLPPYARRLDSLEAIQIPNQDIAKEVSPLLLELRSDDVRLGFKLLVPYPKIITMFEKEPMHCQIFRERVTGKIDVNVRGGEQIHLRASLIEDRTNVPSLAAILYYDVSF